MLLTRTWRCDPLNIELQIWLFQGKALANCKAFVKPISWGNEQKWYTLCYSQEHKGVIHSILNFKIGYFKGKTWPTVRLFWSQFPEAMGKIIHPMLLTRTWRFDPLNIELQNWLFQGQACANCKALVKPIFWGNGQKRYTLCYSQEHEGVIHTILNFKIGYFKGKPWPTARLFWSSFPEAMGKNDTPCYSQEIEGVIHWILNFKIGYFKRKPWPTARLFWSWSPKAMGKIIQPMLLTRT